MLTYIRGIYLFIILHYAFLQNGADKFIHKDLKFLCLIPIIIITGIVLTISTIVLTIFWVYKKIVEIILYLQIGNDFNGLITGCNAIAALSNVGDESISVLIEFESNKTSEEIYNDFYKRIQNVLNDERVDRKMISLRKDFMGYKYYHEIHDIVVEDILYKLKLKPEMSNKDVSEFTEKTLNIPLPRNNDFNWDLHLGTNPIKTGSKNTYMFIIRLHHVLADALTTYNILSNLLGKLDDNNTQYAQHFSERMVKKQHSKTKIKYIFPNNKSISNIISGNNIHKNSYFVNYAEKTTNYVRKIREIKLKLGVSFFHVLMTAYSASLAEYFIKYTPTNKSIPEKLLMAVPKQNQQKRYAKLCSNISYQKCCNDFSCFLFYYPVVPTNKTGINVKDYLLERLNLIKTELDDVYSHLDFESNYILFKTYGEVLTYKMLCKSFGNTTYTSVMSILPIGPKLKMFNDDTLTNLYFYIPAKKFCGLAFTSITYDNKLNIALQGNKDTMKSYDNVNEISVGLFKYLDILYKQIQKVE